MDRISTTVEIILYYLTTTETDGTQQSTTVEIILYYLTYFQHSLPIHIYNSRNYSILLNAVAENSGADIYNSRNYSILLNCNSGIFIGSISTTVEIILYYLTLIVSGKKTIIYNSRNYSILLNQCTLPFCLLHLQQ